MIVPSAADVLRSIGHTFETAIVPCLHGTAERSAAATISHLLRHVTLRIEHEGPILTDDVAKLRTLLTALGDYCRSLNSADALAVATKIEAAVRKSAPPDAHLDLPQTASISNELRAALLSGLDFMRAIRARESDSAVYQSLRKDIRDYLADQLRREAEIIEPAFADRGPRR